MNGRCVEEALVRLELELRELEEAARLLREGKPRSVYVGIGSVVVEVGVEEALEFIELRAAEVRKALRRLKELGSKGPASQQ